MVKSRLDFTLAGIKLPVPVITVRIGLDINNA